MAAARPGAGARLKPAAVSRRHGTPLGTEPRRPRRGLRTSARRLPSPPARNSPIHLQKAGRPILVRPPLRERNPRTTSHNMYYVNLWPGGVWKSTGLSTATRPLPRHRGPPSVVAGPHTWLRGLSRWFEAAASWSYGAMRSWAELLRAARQAQP